MLSNGIDEIEQVSNMLDKQMDKALSINRQQFSNPIIRHSCIKCGESINQKRIDALVKMGAKCTYCIKCASKDECIKFV